MLVRTYVKRQRMEARLRRVDPPSPPPGVALVPWHPELLELHAEVKWLSFQNSVDATIFPNLGRLDGCHRLMESIVSHEGFLPGTTWLARIGNSYCGCIQGVKNARRTGMIQNLAVIDGCRGRGVGKALLAAALTGFRDAGLASAQLEVSAKNSRAVHLYHGAGFVVVKTFYRETQEELAEYAI
jgi:GNAT superfamily N-acetyltransferase